MYLKLRPLKMKLKTSSNNSIPLLEIKLAWPKLDEEANQKEGESRLAVEQCWKMEVLAAWAETELID